jgi:signal transduction histidine kinase
MSQQLKELYFDVVDINEELEQRVQERTNELQLLYLVSSILVDMESPLDQVFSRIMAAISGTLPFTTQPSVRILYANKVYENEPFEASGEVISSGITVNGEARGALEVAPRPNESMLDDSEYDYNVKPLLDAISKVISTSVAHRLSLKDRQKMEVTLRHAQKLESVGQLAAGIAHEINTPTQFVNDNTKFLKDSFSDYQQLIEAYDEILQKGHTSPAGDESLENVHRLKHSLDIDYLNEEIPLAIEQSLEGLQRIRKIVLAMKNFSHPGSDEKVLTDLNTAIETTLDVSRNEWKYVASISKQFDPDLPSVAVLPGELNQVFLNLIVNAAHAIEETGKEQGEITIRTYVDGSYAVVEVSDDGCGIPTEIKERIFDPFFTTKEVGKGSGQGLAIVHSVVVEKHGGMMQVDSDNGKGSTFRIMLPLDSNQVELHEEKSAVCG